MEVQASFDAWLHTECNLTFKDIAEYTPQEIERLQLGWAIREHGASTSSTSGHRRGHQEKREEMLRDLGFQ